MDVDGRLLSLLPDWIGYSRLILAPPSAFFASLASLYLVGRLLLPGQTSLEGVHWSERARRIAPARFVSAFMVIWAAGYCAGFARIPAGPWNVLPPNLLAFLGGLSGLCGAALAAAAIQRRATGEPRTGLRLLRDQLVVYCFLCPQLLIVVGMLATIDGSLDAKSLAALVAAVLGLLASSLYSGLPMARLLGLVRPATPELTRLVAEVSSQLGVEVRSVERIDLGMVNAFAIPGSKRLVFTTRIVDELSEAELRGVIGHELGHLRDHPVGLSMLLGTLMFLPIGLLRLLATHYGLLGIAAAYGVFLVLQQLAMRTSRHGEHKADDAVAGSELDDTDYARALEKLHRLNLSPAVTRRSTSHPSLVDRMQKAGVEPDFPRPEPPSVLRTLTGLAAAIALLAVLAAAAWLPLSVLSAGSSLSEPAALTQLAMRGPKPRAVFRLARIRMNEARFDEALALVDIALELAPGRHAYHAARADLLVRTDRCDAARPVLEQAVDLARDDHLSDCEWIDRAALALSACEELVGQR